MHLRSQVGYDLPANDIDENFHQLVRAAERLTIAPPVPLGSIVDVQFFGDEVYVFLNGGARVGPFAIPRPGYSWQDEWEALASYNVFDVFYAEGEGLFLVRAPYTAPATFDPDAPEIQRVFGLLDDERTARPVVNESAVQRALTMGQVGFYLRCARDTTFTVPTDATASWIDGANFILRAAASGVVRIVAAPGVTITRPQGRANRTNVSGATVFLRRVGPNTWDLWGDLAVTADPIPPTELPTSEAPSEPATSEAPTATEPPTFTEPGTSEGPTDVPTEPATSEAPSEPATSEAPPVFDEADVSKVYELVLAKFPPLGLSKVHELVLAEPPPYAITKAYELVLARQTPAGFLQMGTAADMTSESQTVNLGAEHADRHIIVTVVGNGTPPAIDVAISGTPMDWVVDETYGPQRISVYLLHLPTNPETPTIEISAASEVDALVYAVHAYNAPDVVLTDTSEARGDNDGTLYVETGGFAVGISALGLSFPDWSDLRNWTGLSYAAHDAVFGSDTGLVVSVAQTDSSGSPLSWTGPVSTNFAVVASFASEPTT